MALEQTNDARYGALRDSGKNGANDDMLQETREYWLSVYPVGVGTMNDIKYQFFMSLGFTGSLSDMENRYWSSFA